MHAFNFRDISENRILYVIFRVTVTLWPTPARTFLRRVLCYVAIQYKLFEYNLRFCSWCTVKASPGSLCSYDAANVSLSFSLSTSQPTAVLSQANQTFVWQTDLYKFNIASRVLI